MIKIVIAIYYFLSKQIFMYRLSNQKFMHLNIEMNNNKSENINNLFSIILSKKKTIRKKKNS